MITIADIVAALSAGTFSYADEIDLHRGIDTALRAAGIEFEPEVRLNDADRIDYLVGNVGIEVKVKGSSDALRRQITRYASSPQITRLLVVTTKRSHADLHRQVIGHTLVHVHVIGRLS